MHVHEFKYLIKEGADEVEWWDSLDKLASQAGCPQGERGIMRWYAQPRVLTVSIYGPNAVSGER